MNTKDTPNITTIILMVILLLLTIVISYIHYSIIS
jgi:uncharacterized membrane protein YcaP (DUF421 family)